jgi:hypothetical protein
VLFGENYAETIALQLDQVLNSRGMCSSTSQFLLAPRSSLRLGSLALLLLRR